MHIKSSNFLLSKDIRRTGSKECTKRGEKGEQEMPKPSETNNFSMMVAMPEELVAYLNQLAAEAKATGGDEISATAVVRAAIRALLMENEVDVSGVQNEEELVERILNFSKKKVELE